MRVKRRRTEVTIFLVVVAQAAVTTAESDDFVMEFPVDEGHDALGLVVRLRMNSWLFRAMRRGRHENAIRWFSI